ncbi:MAG TPA: nucleotidyltransferase domain-containing protein [Bryobacteraceae bacterium]|nr:nucleotidyltransferase domain-containing protein [Bryobacteraceae bacterium]
MERLLGQLVERLRKAYGERLTSVILYGSAAAGDYNGKFSDLNVLCVLRDITPRELEESTPVVRWWREQGNPSPLLMSEAEVKGSTDCFPIEFHDIRERHRVLHGTDVAVDLEIDRCFYRAQVEHELRAKLLRLRQKAAGLLGGDKDLLRTMLAESISTFCVLFRHALLLSGAEAKFEKREVIAQAREKFGIDAAPFETLLDLRQEKIKPRQVEPVGLFAEYLKQIQAVIDIVDRLEK